MQDTQPKAHPLGPLSTPLLAFLGLTLGNAHRESIATGIDTLLGPLSGTAIPSLITTFVWLSGAWLCSRLLNSLVVNPLVRRRTGLPAPAILANSLTAAIFIVTVFLIIRIVYDRPVGGLVATSGVVTLIIGFAIRDMIADFFSGLAVNIEQPYRIGDWLELGPGLVGQVTEQNWRATRLTTLSERTVIVPNSDLASRQFVNFSLPQRHFRDSLDIVLNYTTDPERVENILLSAVLATEGPIKGAKHQVRIKGFEERGVAYEVRFWIADYGDRVRIRHKVSANVLHYLSQAGIAIPYSQHEIVLTRGRRHRQERRIDPRRLLSRIDWLDPLDETELRQLADIAVGCDFRAGAVIVREGEPGSSLYVVVEGVAVAGSSRGQEGEATIGQIQPGQAFGEMSMLTGAPRAATVTALTDVYVLELRREDFEPIMRARPEIAEQLGRVMARRLTLNERRSSDQGSAEGSEDLRTRAMQIARKISALFGAH